jgi:hypothetical protein
MKHRKPMQIKGRANPISLVKVSGKDTQGISFLYSLLKSRKHNISHTKTPSFSEHKRFVRNHPYRAWFLIQKRNNYIGSIYVFKNNGIGISVKSGKEDCIWPAITILLKKIKPLKGIKSARHAEFGVYAAPTDKKLIAVLKKMGSHFAQVTFLIPSGGRRR